MVATRINKGVCPFNMACGPFSGLAALSCGWRKFNEILKKKNTKKILYLVEYDGWLFVCAKLALVGLNICECTGKAENHPGRWVSSTQLSGKGTVES